MRGLGKPMEFGRMPNDYPGLCQILMPRPIRDKVDFENVTEMAEAFAGQQLNKDQSDYFDLLCRLIEDYEEQHVPKARTTGVEAVRHLLEEHGMSGADFSRLLGAHRTLGPMILRGERKLTVDYVRMLSRHFRVSADLFLVE